ncbi:hypothetical protein [Streptosporangium vulgare]|uniref:hypothetical protein n=1 Tax=Streptosporangium vulgare TaxID=46190 RepID=UPI003CD0845A
MTSPTGTTSTTTPARGTGARRAPEARGRSEVPVEAEADLTGEILVGAVQAVAPHALGVLVTSPERERAGQELDRQRAGLDVAALLDRTGELRARQLQMGDAEHHPQPRHLGRVGHRERLQEHLGGLPRLPLLQEHLRQPLGGTRSDLRVAGGQRVTQRPLGLLLARGEPGEGHVRQRDVVGVAHAQRGLPGGAGLVGQALPLEASREQAGGLGGELRVPGRQRGARGRARARHVPALLQYHREPHRRLGPVGLAGIGDQLGEDRGGAVEVPRLGQSSRGVQGTGVHLRHAGSFRIRRRPEPNDSGRPPSCRIPREYRGSRGLPAPLGDQSSYASRGGQEQTRLRSP